LGRRTTAEPIVAKAAPPKASAPRAAPRPGSRRSALPPRSTGGQGDHATRIRKIRRGLHIPNHKLPMPDPCLIGRDLRPTLGSALVKPPGRTALAREMRSVNRYRRHFRGARLDRVDMLRSTCFAPTPPRGLQVASLAPSIREGGQSGSAFSMTISLIEPPTIPPRLSPRGTIEAPATARSMRAHASLWKRLRFLRAKRSVI
jgi:hypothetical protein